MGKQYFTSIIGALLPIIVLTTIAMTQLGKYSYTELGGRVVWIQAGYVVLSLPIAILLFIFRKKRVAQGLLVSFGVGFFVSILTLGMGL
jgi:hypothetical protein